MSEKSAQNSWVNSSDRGVLASPHDRDARGEHYAKFMDEFYKTIDKDAAKFPNTVGGAIDLAQDAFKKTRAEFPSLKSDTGATPYLDMNMSPLSEQQLKKPLSEDAKVKSALASGSFEMDVRFQKSPHDYIMNGVFGTDKESKPHTPLADVNPTNTMGTDMPSIDKFMRK